MRNPLRWLLPRSRREKSTAASCERITGTELPDRGPVGAGRDPIGADRAAGEPAASEVDPALLAAVREEVLEAVRGEFEERWEARREEESAHQRELTRAVDELRKLLLRVEMSIQTRVGHLGDEVSQLRDEVSRRLDSVENRGEKVGRGLAEVQAKADAPRRGLGTTRRFVRPTAHTNGSRGRSHPLFERTTPRGSAVEPPRLRPDPRRPPPRPGTIRSPRAREPRTIDPRDRGVPGARRLAAGADSERLDERARSEPTDESMGPIHALGSTALEPSGPRRRASQAGRRPRGESAAAGRARGGERPRPEASVGRSRDRRGGFGSRQGDERLFATAGRRDRVRRARVRRRARE